MSVGTSKGALYYPYIHIENPNWLKANLLMFPHIERMIPMDFLPDDDYVVKEFTQWHGNKEPLLRPANLWSPRSEEAQKLLASKLQKDAENDVFLKKYGMEAALNEKKYNPYGFQIHGEKLLPELKYVLLKGNKLGWKPMTLEPYDFQKSYIEVHPSVGQAVMATLAIACAEYSGLDIVGDNRSGKLHKCLIVREINKVYDTWLSLEEKIFESPTPMSGEGVMEFILGIPNNSSNLSDLSFERIYELTDERNQINKLMSELRSKAGKIRAVEDEKIRDNDYKDAATDVLKNWSSDRNNLSNLSRAIFGQDTTKMATDFAKSIADKTVTGFLTGGATTAKAATMAIASSGWFGTLATGSLIGASAGLVIGIIVHTGTTYRKQVKREKDSPYRFLTQLENAGIVFRSEGFH